MICATPNLSIICRILLPAIVRAYISNPASLAEHSALQKSKTIPGPLCCFQGRRLTTT